MTLAHDSTDAGHPGSDITTAWLKDRVYWKYMEQDVRNYIKGCVLCQRNKPDNRGRQGLPLSISSSNYEPFECICIDFIGPLPRTPRGHDAIMTVIDKLTKYVYYIPTTIKATAQEVLQLLERYVFCEHGWPKVIISDRDARFTSNWWQEVMKVMETTLHRSTSFHPQTDGQSENANHDIEKMLRSCVDSHQTDWDLMLPHCQMAHNDHKSSATGHTPFMLIHGRMRRTRSTAAMEETGVAEKRIYPGAAEFLKRQAERVKLAKELQEKAHTRQRANASQGRREVEIKLKAVSSSKRWNKELQQSLSLLRLVQEELGWPYTGGMKECYDQCDYPDRIIGNDHPGPVTVEHDPEAGGPVVLEKDDPEFEVESIIGRRRYRGREQYRVKWKGWEIEHSSWINESELENAREPVEEYLSRQVGVRTLQLQQQRTTLEAAEKENQQLAQTLRISGAKEIAPGHGRKRTQSQQVEAANRQQKSVEEARASARKQVNENVPMSDASQVARNLINKNGEIKMPTQRCTSNNAKGEQCGRRTQHGDKCWSHLAKEHWVQIQKSTIPNAGKGLFARKDFAVGEVIAKYTGDLIATGSQDGTNGNYSAYILELSRAVSIDAARTNTAVGRMVNDAHGSGKVNNCHLACDQRTKTATVRAIRPIRKGEEFFTSYGNQYWTAKRGNEKKSQPNKKVVKKKPGRKKTIIDLTPLQIVSELEYMGIQLQLDAIMRQYYQSRNT